MAFAANKMNGLLTQWWVAGLLAVCASLVWLGLRSTPDGRLHIFFLDVGQGDAIFIRAPDGRQILVDGGPSPDALLDELGDVMPFWDRSLDLMVLTHPDDDHMEGLLAAPERYRIGLAANPKLIAGSAAWDDVLAARGVTRVGMERGAQLRAGDVVLTVLNPAGSGAPLADDNAASMVLRIDYGRTSALLTGDAPEAVEAEMLAAALPLDADILKVGHHGSADSTSGAFVAAVSPQHAVIQVGADNYFGHPAPVVLDRLRGVEVLRTDLNGRVEAISDGTAWQVRSQRRP
jgi:competence protein ComEC